MPRLCALGPFSLVDRLGHRPNQRPQAVIEFRFAKRFSEYRRIAVRLGSVSVPSRNKGEWDALGMKPLSYGVHGFAMSQLDIEQRRIAWTCVDQGQCLGNPNGGA